MREAIDYIIRFLLHGNETLAARVGYTADAALFSRFSVVIVPSDFWDEKLFGKPCSEPQLPLVEVDGVPLLFGSDAVETVGRTLVVHADVVASAFFLLSRYEEMIFPTEHRDAHGRFLGRESLLGRAGLLQRPLVDEYGALLRGWLRRAGCEVSEPQAEISKIYLTHDVDTLSHYRRLRGFLGGLARAIFSRGGVRLSDVLGAQRSLESDAAYTFPLIFESDALLPLAVPVYFLKSIRPVSGFDRPQYNLHGHDFRHFVAEVRHYSPDARLGLHTSYASGADNRLIKSELHRLCDALHQKITLNRWHYLRSLQPADFRALVAAGITDDFTMGYADEAGFRLGTTRPVHWIDPATGEVSHLVLHPLTVMDCTLDRPAYMGLDEEHAESLVKQLFVEVERHNGEVVLLWHNTSFADGTYHRSLYPKVINMLQLMR